MHAIVAIKCGYLLKFDEVVVRNIANAIWTLHTILLAIVAIKCGYSLKFDEIVVRNVAHTTYFHAILRAISCSQPFTCVAPYIIPTILIVNRVVSQSNHNFHFSG